MIKEIGQDDITTCVKVIRESFGTVAEEFGLNEENAPRFTAFATTEERLCWQLKEEKRPMYAFYEDGQMVGYYSLSIKDNGECECNNLCVLPACRHRGIGEKLLENAFEVARGLHCHKMTIGIVEENQILRRWYESFGFIHIGVHKYDFFPFTCGYLEKNLKDG